MMLSVLGGMASVFDLRGRTSEGDHPTLLITHGGVLSAPKHGGMLINMKQRNVLAALYSSKRSSHYGGPLLIKHGGMLSALNARVPRRKSPRGLYCGSTFDIHTVTVSEVYHVHL